jgi:phospholipid/cholesterol/gamma-HCH transport system substrate-binding protein
MGRNLIETVMGAVVLAVAGFFLAFAYTHADLKQVKGYELTAQFAGAGGLSTGADVRINGIKVGTVSSNDLDSDTFNAVIRLTIMPTIHLPVDTVATIAADGLLGGKFLKLEPGRASERIAAGGTITRTKDYKSIEEMVGELIFLATSDAPGQQSQQRQAPNPASLAPEPEAQTAPPADKPE